MLAGCALEMNSENFNTFYLSIIIDHSARGFIPRTLVSLTLTDWEEKNKKFCIL